MEKLEECARAVVPHICRATQDCDSEQDARDLRQAREIARAVIRCLMELSDRDVNRCHNEPTMNNIAYYRAMLQSVLDESKE